MSRKEERYLMKWNKRIKDLREDNDMTQEELATRLGISKRTLLRYESGVSEPTISVLISLSLLFNVSVDYIIAIKIQLKLKMQVLKIK